jgi:peptidyl-prolyl cis-trans isomerase D
MLKVMRDSFKHLKWILVFVVFLFVFLVFADWGAGGASGRAADNISVAARVNGDAIPIRDFQRALYFTQQNYTQLYGQALTPEMIQALNLPEQVLGSLVDRALLLQEAEKLGLTATEEEIRKRVLEIPALSPDGKFVGAELYERYITANLGYPSAAAFEEEIGQEVTLSKLDSALTNAIVVSPAMAEHEYRTRNENARIQYVLYPADKAAAAVTVTPAEVEASYRQNSGRYSHPEQRRVKYLLADAAQIRAQLKIPESELRAEYEKGKDQYRSGEAVRVQHILIRTEQGGGPEAEAAAKAKADSIYQQLQAGGDFAALAREHSGDPGSAANGGDLGFFERGAMVPEFENAAFSQPIGQVGQPVKSNFGYHIIKVNEKRGSGVRSFEEVRAEIERKLGDERTKALARDRIASARTRLQSAKPDSDDDFRAVTGNGVTFNDTQWFGKSDPIAGIGRSPALSEWAFSAKQGDLGEIIETQRGPIVPWLALARPAGVTPLEEIRAQVEADVRRQKARDAARAALAAAMAGKTIEQTAAAVGSTPTEATISRQGVVQGLNGSARALIDAALTATVGQVGGPVVVDDGAVAFRLLEQKKFDPAAFAAERDSLISTMRTNEARKLRASLIAKLRRDAEVVMNNELLQQAQQPVPQS